MLFCVAQQIQESKRRYSDQYSAVRRVMCSIVIRTLGDNDGCAGIPAQFNNGVVIGNRRLFTIFDLDKDFPDVRMDAPGSLSSIAPYLPWGKTLL